MKYDVFISYSRKDFSEVLTIKQAIEQNVEGIKIWFDINGIESGDEFEDKIIKAINNSSYLLFALSPNSIGSQWTKDEVIYAKNTGKKVIPILLRGAKLEGGFLFHFGRIDCIDSTNHLQMDKLTRNLSNWCGLNYSIKKKDNPIPSKSLNKKSLYRVIAAMVLVIAVIAIIAVDSHTAEDVVRDIPDSLLIDEDQKEMELGQYAFTSKRLITEDDLTGLTGYDLKIMRNEIFARHGLIFKTEDMKAYFNAQPWYQGKYDDVTSMLSDIELKNVSFIKKHE